MRSQVSQDCLVAREPNASNLGLLVMHIKEQIFRVVSEFLSVPRAEDPNALFARNEPGDQINRSGRDCDCELA